MNWLPPLPCRPTRTGKALPGQTAMSGEKFVGAKKGLTKPTY